MNSQLYEALLTSPFRVELEAELGAQFFKLIECEKRAFSPEIITDMQEENRLSSEYSKLIASAKIPFQGEEYTLPGLAKFAQDKNRGIREAASQARYDFFTENEATIDEIYDQLVHVRVSIAKKLGFNNFTELGYVRIIIRTFHAHISQLSEVVKSKLH